MTESYQRKEDPTGIFQSLGAKFSKNLEASLTGGEGIAALIDVELKARTFVAVGRVLGRNKDLSPSQRGLLSVFDELFSDAICSVYLTGCALDRPAQMVLRRVLELGVGIVYLWDLPHRFCGWKYLDQDLSFNEMLDHIGSPEYKAYIYNSKELENTP